MCDLWDLVSTFWGHVWFSSRGTSTLSGAGLVVSSGRQALFLGRACMKAYRLPLWPPPPDSPQEDRSREGLARLCPVSAHLSGLGPFPSLLEAQVGSPADQHSDCRVTFGLPDKMAAGFVAKSAVPQGRVAFSFCPTWLGLFWAVRGAAAQPVCQQSPGVPAAAGGIDTHGLPGSEPGSLCLWVWVLTQLNRLEGQVVPADVGQQPALPQPM